MLSDVYLKKIADYQMGAPVDIFKSFKGMGEAAKGLGGELETWTQQVPETVKYVKQKFEETQPEIRRAARGIEALGPEVKSLKQQFGKLGPGLLGGIGAGMGLPMLLMLLLGGGL